MEWRRRSVTVAVLSAVAALLAAHAQVERREQDPAFRARYDINRPLLIRGFVEAVERSETSTWLVVRETSGDKAVWRVDAGSTANLRREGVAPRLVAGAKVVLRAYGTPDGGRTAAVVRPIVAYAPQKHPFEGRRGPLTDEDLLRYAAAPFDHGYWSGESIVLGMHNGAEVVADHYCEHLCPSSLRVIRYSIPAGPACEAIGGKVRQVGQGGGTRVPGAYCVPAVLVDGRQASR